MFPSVLGKGDSELIGDPNYTPVMLDLDYYKKLWKPNDLQRLAAVAFNTDIDISYVYDYIVRFMRHILEKEEDGYAGLLADDLMARHAGWPQMGFSMDCWFTDSFLLCQSFTSLFRILHDGFVIFTAPKDREMEYVRATYGPEFGRSKYDMFKVPGSKCSASALLIRRKDPIAALKVRDPEIWRYYIANSDPRIGTGDFGCHWTKSGPRLHLRPGQRSLDIKETEEEAAWKRLAKAWDKAHPEHFLPLDQKLPKEIHDLFQFGNRGDKMIHEVIADYNLNRNPDFVRASPEDVAAWQAAEEEFAAKGFNRPENCVKLRDTPTHM